MTVTIATITRVSRGRITISADDLEYYSGFAVETLDVDNPGFPAATYDRALALLICHYYSADERDDLEMKSEDRGGDWKYSKEPGMTTYLIEYRDLLAQFGRPADVPVDGTVRGDATMTGANLDLNPLPYFTETEDTWLV